MDQMDLQHFNIVFIKLHTQVTKQQVSIAFEKKIVARHAFSCQCEMMSQKY